ncbi:MAG: hypothetical protein NDI91_01795 [Sulfuritalea sp.]|nr:hypothetical protein [Sulfuritalea sp.]
MKLMVVQLNFGYGGGSAFAYIYGPEPTDVFAPHPHLAIHINRLAPRPAGFRMYYPGSGVSADRCRNAVLV